jgi:hypothetical protein
VPRIASVGGILTDVLSLGRHSILAAVSTFVRSSDLCPKVIVIRGDWPLILLGCM